MHHQHTLPHSFHCPLKHCVPMELTDDINALVFAKDELNELEFLPDQEIDLMIDENKLDCNERFNTKLRDGFRFAYPEMVRMT